MTATSNWPEVLTALVKRVDLTGEQSSWAMGQILAGDATAVQIAGFAVALRSKGETVSELSGLAQAMLDNATRIELPGPAVDVVGSGGDRANTVNVSTMAAIVARAAGANVVKHGNRAASSACGTADCLEALGVVLALSPEQQAEVFRRTGISFLFAPLYHPSLRHASGPRGELGIQTTFNFLGPLANPARPAAQAVGVADPHMAPLMAGVLAGRGVRGLVFHGDDGLDELTTTTASKVWLFADGRTAQATLDPAELGISRSTRADLVGGLPAENAEIVRRTFAGSPGPVRDIVLLNAAAALLAFHGLAVDQDVAEQLRPHLAAAAAAVDSGEAAALLERWASETQSVAG